LWGARATANGGRFSPEWAPWIPNIVMGIGGLVMVAWRARVGDQPIRLALPAFLRRKAVGEPSATPGAARRDRPARRLPRFNLPLPRVLDLYISREYLRLIVIGILGLLAIFYISTFIDLADKLFRGETTGLMLARYFYFRTPQFVYYVIPMSVLVSTLVTVGIFTKNSELLVMRACGISLYRAALPLLICGVLASGVLFVMQERVLVSSNREADKLERTIRHWPEATTALNRRWMVGSGGEMYHYDFFDQRANRFSNLLVYKLDEQAWQLRAVTRATDTLFIPPATPGRNWLSATAC
jgi:lipopolysaccharide export LptBFGC system permease protein LptF